jgi:HAD superfamily hydrolase (TIGR01549 family)
MLLSNKKITGILFDLDGTLRHNSPTFNEVFFKAVELNDLANSIEKRKNSQRWLHYYWAQSPELLADMDNFKGHDDLFWINHTRLNLMAYGCSTFEADRFARPVYEHIRENYFPGDWVAPDVHETLNELKDRGYALAVLSNRRESCALELAELELLDYFDFVLVAGEVNSWKPNPEIFLSGLERLGTAPKSTLYIGDNYYADVVGAENAGLIPVLFDPEAVFPDVTCLVIKTIGDLLSLFDE